MPLLSNTPNQGAYIYTHTHTHTHIYIYIYIYLPSTKRETAVHNLMEYLVQ